MSLLDRLVLREILFPLAVGVLAILQLLIVFQLLQINQVVFGAAVSVVDLARITSALAPHFLVMALPLAFMLGVQLGLGRLAGDQEVLAMSAAGISPSRLFRMPFVIALVLAVAVAFLVRVAEPWGLRQLSSVVSSVIKRNLESGLEPGVFNSDFPSTMVYVQAQDRGAWRGVLIESSESDGSRVLTLAESGNLEEMASDVLGMHLVHGELHRHDDKGETVARFGDGTFRVGVGDPVSRRNRFAGLDQAMSDAELRERSAWAERNGWLEDAARMRFELVRRYSAPFACLAFALLGVPIAVRVRGTRAASYVVTLSAFVAYYASSRLALALAQRGLEVWFAGWLPVLLIAAVGAWFTAGLLRTGAR